jgi:hypothetical protein
MRCGGFVFFEKMKKIYTIYQKNRIFVLRNVQKYENNWSPYH